jgi:L,D-transpeptidase ErfK/SrfK
VGETRIIRKKKDPSWTVPLSIRKEHEEGENPLPAVVRPGPDNPLGQYALYLGMNGYLMHGTNKPFGVGMRVSHGCIRLYPEDIEYFFNQIPVGTAVRIINQPYKAGWHRGELYVEAHHPLSEQVKQNGLNYTGLVSAVLAKLEDDPRKPEWSQLQEQGRLLRGLPMPLYLWDEEVAANKKDPSSID